MKIKLVFAILLTGKFALCQNNLVGTIDDIGIGTTSPASKLTINCYGGQTSSTYNSQEGIKLITHPNTTYGMRMDNVINTLFTLKPSGRMILGDHNSLGSNVAATRFMINSTSQNDVGMNIMTSGTSGHAILVEQTGTPVFAVWPNGGLSAGSAGQSAAGVIDITASSQQKAISVFNKTANLQTFKVENDGSCIFGVDPQLGNANVVVNSKWTSGINVVTSNASGYAFAVHNSDNPNAVPPKPAGVFAIWNDGRVDIGKSGNGGAADVNINVSGTTANALDIFNTTTARTEFRVKTDGKVYAREIHINTLVFPDYVFDGNYKLMPMDELAHYIKVNHHLPNMPSADQVVGSTQELGNIQRLTLEKLEELYLYSLSMKEEISDLKKRNEILEEKLKNTCK
jgi:hypothetical protein